MNWGTLAWIVIAIVAIFVMARGCGGIMGVIGCGTPRQHHKTDKKQQTQSDKSHSDKAA